MKYSLKQLNNGSGLYSLYRHDQCLTRSPNNIELEFWLEIERLREESEEVDAQLKTARKCIKMKEDQIRMLGGVPTEPVEAPDPEEDQSGKSYLTINPDGSVEFSGHLEHLSLALNQLVRREFIKENTDS